MEKDYCMMLALPCGRDHTDIYQQTRAMSTGFIQYLQQKQAAGIVNVADPGSQQVNNSEIYFYFKVVQPWLNQNSRKLVCLWQVNIICM
jgi:UDP-N-acetylmuramate-alanine ligase